MRIRKTPLSPFSRPTVKISLVSVFTALALGTNYAMIGLVNIKLMDAIVFIAAFLFGLDVGVASAISIWLVYGLVNPYGPSDPLTFFFVTLGECFYAIGGALLSRTSAAQDLLKAVREMPSKKRQNSPFDRNTTGVRRLQSLVQAAYRYGRLGTLFGLVGLQSTFAYDVLTNFGTYLFKTDSAYHALLVGMITGIPFAIAHEGSNLVLFAFVVPAAIVASRRWGINTHMDGGERVWQTIDVSSQH